MTSTSAGTGTGTVAFEFATSIEIDAPARAVLDYVSNPRSWPQWMPATHEIRSDDRPILAGETFAERWGTSKGEVGLAWRVTERVEGEVWVAETETAFTGPIVCRYEVEDLGDGRCRYTRRIQNPARPKAPTDEMVARMRAEADVCLANIKRNVEAAAG